VIERAAPAAEEIPAKPSICGWNRVNDMLRIWLAALAVLGTMIVVKDHHVLQRTHLAGYCTTTLAPDGDRAHWQACHSGKLSGAPDLSRDSCKRKKRVGRVELWRCPENVSSLPFGG
jgi:hypothetical protein